MRPKAELTATATALPQRPEPPAGMPADGRRYWREITACYPPSHFAGANLGLLEQLCRARAFVTACDRAIAKRGLMVKNRFGASVVNPLIAARATGWAEVRACCTKLRLAISSTWRAEKAQARPDPKHALRKPWE